MATARIYHYATGKWEKEEIANNNYPLIGYYANGIWWNDLWLELTDESIPAGKYKKITSVDLTINLEKLLIKDNANPMKIAVGIYQQLPSVVTNKFTRYTLDDVKKNLIGEINTDAQESQSFTINKSLTLTPSSDYYVSSQYYIHLYINNTDNNGLYSNNTIKAYYNELTINFEPESEGGSEDKVYSKAIYTVQKYGYNSNYIEKTIVKDVYYSGNELPEVEAEFKEFDELSADNGYIYSYTLIEGANSTWKAILKYDTNREIKQTTNSYELFEVDKDVTLNLGTKYTASFINTENLDYIFNHWEINGESYGNQPKLTFTLTPEMVDFSGTKPTFTLIANKTPKVYTIAIPALNEVYSFTDEDARPPWPKFPEDKLLNGWTFKGWKNVNGTIYNAEEKMPLQSMIVEPVIEKDSKIFTTNIPYNPLGYYTLAPLVADNESEEIYAYTTDLITGTTKPAGPVYSIYEVMDTATFNQRFQGINTLYPLTHEKIAGNPLIIYQKDEEWGSEQNGYLYQKTKEGVWRRVN